MAKNPFWLRGARGKFAGSVVQKSENGTVIRENVKPRNPKTTAQMIVRVVFGTLNTAAYWLQKIVGQTFEKTENAAMNKRAFVSRNFPALRACAVLDDSGTRSQEGAFDPKGSRILSPNPYMVSHGSLPTPSQLKVSVASSNDDFENDGKTLQLEDGNYTAAFLWENLIGLKAGQQLTLVQIETKDGEDVAYDRGAEFGQDAGFNIQRFAELSSARLVLKEGTGNTLAYTDATTQQQLIACLASLVDKDKTSSEMWNEQYASGLIGCITVGNGSIGFNILGLIGDVSRSGWTQQSVGFIISQLLDGYWHYNICKLASKAPDYQTSEAFDGVNFGLKITEAVASYRTSSSSESELYTRQGGVDNSVNF